MKNKLYFLICCVLVTLLASCGSDSDLFAPLGNFDTFSVIACTPISGQVGVDPDDVVTIVFNNDADIADVERNFTLSGDSGQVEGQFQWITRRAFRFVPRYQLTISERYVIEIPRTVRDRHGNTMEMAFISDFYVGSDFERPGVISSMPAYNPGGVLIDPNNPADPNFAALSDITINFSRLMDRTTTEAAFSISPSVPGYFVGTTPDDQLVYHFTAELEYGKQYKVTVASTAEDTAGNTLSRDFTVSFIVGTDMTPPEITGINNGIPPYWDTTQINEGIEKKNLSIYVEFSEDMDRNSCEDAFSISPAVNGYFTWSGNNIMIYNTTEDLESEGVYTIRVDTLAEDLNGLSLENPYQVVIKANGPNSLHITVGNVSGSFDDGITDPYALLFTGPPAPALWPINITWDASQEYYFTIQFLSGGNPVAMNQYSIFDSWLLEDWGDGDPIIVQIDWVDASTVKLKCYPIWQSVLHRLTILGGENGVKDMNDNTMSDNFVFEFMGI